MANRSLMYEFIVPSEIHIADVGDWPGLVVSRHGLDLALLKPFTGTKAVGLERTYGNQSLPVGYSIFHVVLNVDDAQPTPDWEIPHQLVNECLQWIRVTGTQYWVGFMPTMTKDIARGSVMEGEKQFTNFAGSVCPVSVRPFTKEMWEWVGTQLARNRVPPIPDLLMSDALISFSNRDFLQTIIRLGVICELALNAFIEDLLTRQPEVAQQLYDERKPFKEKLKNIPGILGAERFQDYNETRYKNICQLYDLRGAAIHRAKLVIDGQPVNQGHVAGFIFSTLNFLQWTQDQRVKLNIAI